MRTRTNYIAINMTTANTTAKIAAVLAGIGLVASSFAVFAPAARAQTAAELQAQINALLAQIAALQGNTGTTASVSFSRDLTIGATGADVTSLQNWLISKGYSIPAGATGYFGTQTQAAVAAYQAANSIAPAAGYFGPITRAHVNAAAAPGTGTGTGTGSADISGGEADVRSVKLFAEDDASADSRDQLVGTFEIDLARNSGDIRVTRVDVHATTTSGTENRLFRLLEAVTIADANGRELGSANTSSRNDWTSSDLAAGAQYVRISGLNGVARGDARTEFQVLVDTARLADSELPANIQFAVEIRYEDASGAIETEPRTSTVTFSIEGADSADLRVRASSDNPEASTIKGDDSSSTNDVEVLVFDVESRKVDFTIEEVDVEITATYGGGSASGVDKLVRRAHLYAGSSRIDSQTVDNAGKATFDLREYDIRSDRREEFSIRVDLNEIDGTIIKDGATVKADVKAVRGYDENDNDEKWTGTVAGKVHTYSETVASVSGVKATITQAQNQSASGTIAFEFKVEAVDGDVELTAAGLNAAVSQSTNAGTPLAKPSPSLTKLSGDAALDNATWTIDEGQSATFILEYAYTTASSTSNGNYRLTLDTVAGEKVDVVSPALSLAHGS